MSSPDAVGPSSEHLSSSSTSTPSQSVTSLPASTSANFFFPFRARGQSTSVLRSPSPSAATLSPLSRVTSAPSVQSSDDATIFSFSRTHSRSPPSPTKKLSISEDEPWKLTSTGAATPPHGAPSTWWNRTEIASRGWKDSPRRKKTVPPEHTEAWLRTRERVKEAVNSVLGNAGDVAHEALAVSVDVLRFAPVVGLSEAARTLLNIWDSLQQVDMNRLQALRLTERCADILLSVREEIAEAGDDVADELKHPLLKLVESFTQVHVFLQKQIHRPFLKRYLKRDEILRQIAACDASLSDSVGLFSLSIQIRILKQVQHVELRRRAEEQALLSSWHPEAQRHEHGSLLLSTEPEELPVSLPVPFPTSEPTTSSLPSTFFPATPLDADALFKTDPSQIRTALRTLHARQNELDQARDMVDLRGLMRVALQATSDAAMIEVLQVGRDEMPEAIKTLQRALELEVEKENAIDGAFATTSGAGSSMARRISIKEVAISVPPVAESVDHEDSGQSTMSRQQTMVSISSVSSGSTSSIFARDTLDREFIESGIDALRRMSNSTGMDLPSWTITRYEVDREEKIGIGFFSDVYRGTWGDRTVAIKVLARTTPRELFLREASIWKTLRHRNVLELYGASAASSEGPWFFVSPYMRNGNLVSYLKNIAGKRWGSSESRNHSRTRGTSGNDTLAGYDSGKEVKKTDVKDGFDMLKMMYEIARGMQYLHSMGVLHGDLKGTNILVDAKIRCVISDFGQSEMKSEVYRISGAAPPHGTLRWQAPELLAGQSNLTTQGDVYAYAICCIEILTMGSLPWSMLDDDSVRHIVLKEDQRPPIPPTRVSSAGLQELLRLCWHRDPFIRPSFSKVVWEVKQLHIKAGANLNLDEARMSPRPMSERPLRRSPDMHPIALPPVPPETNVSIVGEGLTSPTETYHTAEAGSPQSPVLDAYLPKPGEVQMVHPVMFTPSINISRTSSIFTSAPGTASDDGFPQMDYAGYDSPPPANERLAELRNERRYRLLLAHEYHPSLILPLWSPAAVALGAVGYLSKPSGTFITLFNAFDPTKSSGGVIKGMPTVYGFGQVTQGSQRQDKRNIAQKGLDAISGFLTFKSKGDGSVSPNANRRYSYPLRSGHRSAYLCAEITMYRYVENLDAPKQWFKANVDTILRTFGPHHPIQKEDLYLVIGTLDAPDYAMFVSHQHPDGQVHFNIFSPPKTGHDWGMFTTDTDVPVDVGGPSYHEELLGNTRICANKVSTVGGSWDTVLIARLRFKPDSEDPTSL